MIKQVTVNAFKNRSFKCSLQFFFQYGTCSVNEKIYFLRVTQILHRTFLVLIFNFLKCNCTVLRISKAHFKNTALEVIRYNFALILVSSVFPIFSNVEHSRHFPSYQSF